MASTLLLGGCAYHQQVAVPYPRWGEEVALPGSSDMPPLRLHTLAPERAEGCILLMHGMNEYIGRYGDIAHHFARRYRVAGFDLFAHGLSNPVIAAADRKLADGASHADVSRAYTAQAALSDLTPMRRQLARALEYLADECGDRPIFVVAHSLGALVTASYLLYLHENMPLTPRIAGTVLLGPAFSVPEVPGWRGWLENPAIRFSFWAESRFLCPPQESLPFSLLGQLVAVPGTLLLRGVFEVASWPGIRALTTPVTPDWVPDYLTDWEEERARHRADGYIVRRTLLRYVKGVEREIVAFRRRMADFPVPYLLVYSGDDPITAAWGNLEFIEATRGNHGDNEVLALEHHSHHEHLFSSPPLRGEILRYIDDWLNRRLQSLAEEK